MKEVQSFDRFSQKSIQQINAHRIDQLKWRTMIKEVHCIKEEIELINLLNWGINTKMPVQKIHSYRQIDANKNNINYKFAKVFEILIENIELSESFHDLNYGQAIYLIIQLILGKYALLYKMGINCSLKGFQFGLNCQGQCKILLPLNQVGFKQYNHLKMTNKSNQIIQEIFRIVYPFCNLQAKKTVHYLHQSLIQHSNIHGNIIILLIQQYCRSNNLYIANNLSKFINRPLNRQISNRLPGSDIKYTNISRQFSQSFSQRTNSRPIVQWNYKNPQKNRPKTLSSSICILPKNNQVNMAYSLCIQPQLKSINRHIDDTYQKSEKQDPPHEYQNHQVGKRITQKIISLKRNDISNITTSVGGSIKDSVIEKHYLIQNSTKDHFLLTNANLINLELMENQTNKISFIVNEQQTQIPSNHMHKLSKLATLLQKQNKIQEINQSFSIDSPDKKSQSNKLFSGSKSPQIYNSSVKKQQECISPSKKFNGWKINMNLLQDKYGELKQSMQCGQQINSYLDNLSLTKLGSMGRVIEMSQIPQQN